MKRILSLFLLIALFQNTSYSQSSNKRQHSASIKKAPSQRGDLQHGRKYYKDLMNKHKTTKAIKRNGDLYRLDSVIVDKADNNGNMQNQQLSIFIYNEQQQLSEDKYYDYDILYHEWMPSGRYENIFNDDGQIQTEKYWYWDDTDFDWFNVWAAGNLYENGLQTQRVEQEWNNDINNWAYSMKVNFNYDSNNLLSEKIESSWNSSNKTFENAWRNEYTYNTDGLLSSETEYEWVAGAWVNNWKMEIIYSNNNSTATSTEYYSENNIWQQQFKFEDSYTPDGSLALTFEFEWKADLNQWTSTWKTVFEYDNDILSPISPYWLDIPAHARLSTKTYQWVQDSWALVQDEKMFYSLLESQPITAINESEVIDVAIFPNPASNLLSVQMSDNDNCTISIIDLQGRELINANFAGKHSFSIENLKPGCYIVRINKENSLQTVRKIMKE